jgi:hypothetical protein
VEKRVAECDPTPLDRAFAVKWYAEGWIDCWNSNRPQRVRQILTEDFMLDSPTTRHTGWHVQGHQATMDYIRYVLNAYPDLRWEVTAPPMFSDTVARAAFTWRGTGHFTGRDGAWRVSSARPASTSSRRCRERQPARCSSMCCANPIGTATIGALIERSELSNGEGRGDTRRHSTGHRSGVQRRPDTQAAA